MHIAVRTSLVLAAAIALSGCTSTQPRTQDSSPERDASMIGGIMQLEGTWVMTDENGTEMVATTYKPTAAGSAVHEVMFPGMEHEMVNLYHMDGSDLVVTHDCAAGNQPRMVASKSTTGVDGSRVYFFDFDSVSNYRADQGHYMGNLTLTINGDRLTQTWVSLDSEGNKTDPVVFEMTRR